MLAWVGTTDIRYCSDLCLLGQLLHLMRPAFLPVVDQGSRAVLVTTEFISEQQLQYTADILR